MKEDITDMLLLIPLYRALISAKIPSRLEPIGMSRTSYRCQATCAAGKVVAAVEERKVSKCANLGLAYLFTPVAIETLGTFGPKTLAFVKELGRRVRKETGKEKATSHLFQCLSMATQRGNAAATLGTYLPS